MGIVNCAQMWVSLNVIPTRLAWGLHTEKPWACTCPCKMPSFYAWKKKLHGDVARLQAPADPQLPGVRSGTVGSTWHRPLRTLALPSLQTCPRISACRDELWEETPEPDEESYSPDDPTSGRPEFFSKWLPSEWCTKMGSLETCHVRTNCRVFQCIWPELSHRVTSCVKYGLAQQSSSDKTKGGTFTQSVTSPRVDSWSWKNVRCRRNQVCSIIHI